MNKFIKTALLFLILFSSCTIHNNPLVGNTYKIEPINEAVKLKLEFSSATITHEYEDNSTVKVVTYINNEPTKTEELSYSYNENTYQMDNEVYDVSFKSDTVVLSISGSEFIRLVPVKLNSNSEDSEKGYKSIGGGSSIKIYSKKR